VTKKKILLLTLIVLLLASVMYLALVPIDLSERTPYIKSGIDERDLNPF
jgi:hypothetical protein